MTLADIENRHLEPPESKAKVVGECYICGADIHEGQLIYTDGFERCCLDCIKDMSAKQFIKEFLREDFTEAEGYL